MRAAVAAFVWLLIAGHMLIASDSTFAQSIKVDSEIVCAILLAVNRQPSTVNRQPSTVNRQPSTVNRRPSTVNHQPSSTAPAQTAAGTSRSD
jgi:hypothetical protein